MGVFRRVANSTVSIDLFTDICIFTASIRVETLVHSFLILREKGSKADSFSFCFFFLLFLYLLYIFAKNPKEMLLVILQKSEICAVYICKSNTLYE